MKQVIDQASLLLRSLARLRREQVLYRPLRVAQYRCYERFPHAARLVTPAQGVLPSARATQLMRAALPSAFRHLTRPLDESDGLFADLLAGRFTFLNHTLTLEKVDWNRRYVGHLWNYQFHYFTYAVPCARAFVERDDATVMRRGQELIESWIEGARVGASDGWDAYPISLRVVNWIYAYALLADVYEDREFIGRWRASLYQQLEFLSRHLELHLLANHLLKNAKALVIGGLFFADDERGQEWLREGERLLWRELEEEVLADGGHYERAPMYHAIALADFVECFALLRGWKEVRGERWPEAEQVGAKLRRMARFLEAMTHPDGTLALFNDSANAEDAQPVPILAAARAVCGEDEESCPTYFPDTGYYSWRSADGRERVVVDAGPPAVGYNMAHAHCDLLSYELWLDGAPFVVDAGVHGYGGDPFREYARSTRAHNTVMFDGREQSEVWSTFRVARSAEVVRAEVRGDARAWDFRGAYTPFYDRSLTHERRIQRTADGVWTFTDVARGAAKEAVSFIHLHPNFEAREVGGARVECRGGARTVLLEPFAADRIEVIKGAHSPVQGWRFADFGVAEPCATIQFHYRIKPGEPFGYRIKKVVGGP